MVITDIRIRQIEKESKLKAVASITFDESFAVHDIKIIDGDKGLFIAMPSKKTLEGEYRDIVHPINQEFRSYLQGEILKKYAEIKEESISGEN
ncbi:MAG: septation regulator SpoVG [Lachnospiraceae bacterium]|jgi:stage V sporulation protein G|nr:septation regulator SpoVG [Lachnospiraceae bacterium]